jgi:hypothetical protein
LYTSRILQNIGGKTQEVFLSEPEQQEVITDNDVKEYTDRRSNFEE